MMKWNRHVFFVNVVSSRIDAIFMTAVIYLAFLISFIQSEFFSFSFL